MKFSKTYSDVNANEVLVRPGHPPVARPLVVKALRQAHDDEATLQAEIATRVAKLEAAREAGIAIQDEFDSAVNERAQLRKNIAVYESTIANGIARMAELRRWICSNFTDSPTVEQHAEFDRHERLGTWLPELIDQAKSRLVALDKTIAEMAKQNDLEVPI